MASDNAKTSSSVHPAQLGIEILLRACRVENTRRGGPGGQRRNKVETAVVIEHLSTGAKAQASERRSRQENLRLAVWRLRRKLAMEVRMAGELPAPSEVWHRHLTQGRLSVREDHEDVPAMLAESLDVLEQLNMDVAAAAERLQCSTTQLVRFLGRDAEVFARVNQNRSGRGLSVLKR